MGFSQNWRMKKLFLIVLLFVSSHSAFAYSLVETVKFGAYSGRPGYYVKVGLGVEVVLNAVLMNEQVYKKAVQIISKNKKPLEPLVCDVIGTQQDVGGKEAVYLLYSIKSCK